MIPGKAGNALHGVDRQGEGAALRQWHQLLIYAVKSELFTAGSSAEKCDFRLTHAALRRIGLTADVY
jgi:hypothetical protein